MSDWRQKMKEESKGSDFPKLDILTRLHPKTIESSQCLTFFTKDENGNSVQKNLSEIEGILIGSYKVYTAFSQSENRSYTTTPFFDKTNQVKIFTTKQCDKVDFKGTATEAQDWIFLKTKSTVKMHLVLVFLREKGFVTVETNMSLGICLMSRIGESRMQYLISVKAKLYDPNDFKKDKLPENFKKMAEKNKPTYADLTVTTKEIDQNISDSYRINEQYDKYIEYKKFVTNGNTAVVEEEKDELEHEQIPASSEYNFTNQAVPPVANSDDSDLPF